MLKISEGTVETARRLYDYQGWTRPRIARELGVSLGSVNNFLRGRRRCSGIVCPVCQKTASAIETRNVEGGIRRARQCENCGNRFSTFESATEFMRGYGPKMKSQKVFFVVVPWMGRETPALYHDEIPKTLSKHMVFGCRLDVLPDAEYWLSMNTSQLYNRFCELRKRNALPESNIGKSDFYSSSGGS